MNITEYKNKIIKENPELALKLKWDIPYQVGKFCEWILMRLKTFNKK